MSEKKLVQYILEFVHPQSVIELGCGAGEMLQEFKQHGARIQGVDLEEYGQKLFWQENKDFFQSADLEKVRINCQNKFDLAICLEFAQNLPEERAESFIQDICLLSDVVLFSAGIPEQEENIKNGQMPSYWVNMFQNNGFLMLDCLRPRFWEDTEIDVDYRQNVLLYVKGEALAKYPSLLKFYMNHGGDSFYDIVHPEFLKKITDRIKLHVMSPKKDRALIVCKMNAWEDLFNFIDTDEIEICAYFGNRDKVPDYMRDEMGNRLHPLDELFSMIESFGVDYYIFVCEHNDMMYSYYPKLRKYGIEKHKIIDLQVYLGNLKWMGLMYQYQWRWLKDNKPKLDYFVTGSSTCNVGFDLESMKPYSGIKLAANSQDLYYQYRMAKLYLDFCEKEGRIPKFAISYIGTNTFTFKTLEDQYYYQDLLYFPLISHDDMEYAGMLKGIFLKKLLKNKYAGFIKKKLSNIKNISLNDRDGLRASMNLMEQWDDKQLLSKVNYMYHKVNTNKQMIPVNMDILDKYIKLCDKFNVKLICVRDPWAGDLEKECPAENAREYYDAIEHFKNRIHFIDLWGMNLPREMFSDFVHPNFKGAKRITEVLKIEVDKIINE